MASAADLECAAYHQAGHAAALLVADRWFPFVGIQPDDTTPRRCTDWHTPPRFHPDRALTPANERYLRDHITCLLAGPVAEARHCAHVPRMVEETDLARAQQLSTYLVSDPAELEPHLAWLRTRAATQLARPDVWAGLERIATGLLARTRLTYNEASVAWRSRT